MGHTDNRNTEKRESLTEFLAEIAGRLLTSLLFWGSLILLAISAYTDIAKIGGESVRWSRRAGDAAQQTIRTAQAGVKPQKSIKTAGAEELVQENVQTAQEGVKPQESIRTVQAEDLAQERRQIALTFDDGPHPRYTKLLLDGLKKRGVAATFFVVGKNISGNEELIARMEQEGHLIGNHTYDHVKISDLSAEQACAQVERTSALVREITGKDTEFIRPPFGEWNKDMECSFTMIPVLWSVDPLDWTTENTSLIRERILKDVQEGDIILMHDYYRSSVDAALDVVDALLAQGYEFVTVDKLILE